jgi:signal transduction histidine kinase
LWTAAAAVAVCAGSATFVALAGPSDESIDRALLEALITGVPLAVGLYAARSPGSARFGMLLLGAGFIWSLTALGESSASLPYSIGRVVAWLIFPVLIYLMLAYPEGRITSRLDRLLFGGVAGLIAVLYIGSALFIETFPVNTPWASCDGNCPANAFMLLDSEPAAMKDVIQPLREVLGVFLLAGVTVSLVRRVLGAAPLARRMTSPVLLMSALSTVLLATYLVVRRSAPDSSAVQPLATAWALCIPGIAAAFFAGLLQSRLMLGDVLKRLSITMGHRVEGRELRAVLASALNDPDVDVLVPDQTPGRWRDTRGRTTSRSAAVRNGRAITVIEDGGVVAAALVHDPTLRDDDELLQAAGSLVLAALRHERLTSDLAASLGELEDSRTRIARAADIERSRIERDLHDGAQQRLITLRIKLSLAEELTESDPAAAAAALRDLSAEVDLALDDLRALAHGVYPSLLTDRGLRDALRGVATESPMPVHLDARGAVRHGRDIETAVYFVCLEAVQNAVKHADGATGVWIALRQEQVLSVEVRDDGSGFTPRYEGNGGLRNMRDRVESVGGRLIVDAAPGHGTRILVSVPPVRAGAASRDPVL